MSSLRPTTKCLLGIGIIFFLLMKSKLLLSANLPLWDEAVYLTMGKHFITLGELGMWEILRPPLFPILLGILQLLGDPIFLGTVFVTCCAIGSALVFFALLRDHMDSNIAAITSLILLFSDPWFSWSNHLLTGVVSSFFLILGCYLVHRRRPLVAGIVCAAAFLTRFPAGMVLFAVCVYYFALLFASHHRKKAFQSLIWYGIGAGVPILSWLFVNWWTWNAETATWWHAAFRPLLFGSTNVALQNTWLYDTSLLFYVLHLATTLPLVLFVLLGIPKLREYHGLFPLSLTGILLLGFFTLLPHNEWRFIIIALPGLLALSSLGISTFAKKLPSHQQAIALVLLLSILGGLVVVDDKHMKTSVDLNEPEILPFYNFLRHNAVSGPVIINDPVAAWYVPNKVIPIYFEHLPKFRHRLAEPHDAVVFTPHAFPCQQEDTQCKKDLQEVVDRLTTTERLIYQSTWLGNTYYIFSSKDWYPALPVNKLREKYDLAEEIVLSPHPFDSLPVVIVLEDFPSLNEEKTAIWKEKSFEETLSLFSGVKATAALIPTHVQKLATLEPDVVSDLSQFELAQNGYDHGNLLFVNQSEDILSGKNILERIYNKPVSVFVPPFYSANQETARILDENGYSVYISTIGDPVQTPMRRVDQTNSLIINWDKQVLKTPTQVRNDLLRLSRYGDYALVSIYYFMYEGKEDVLNETVQELSQFTLMHAHELAQWLAVKEQTNFSVSGNTITVDAPADAVGITLLLRQSGDYVLVSQAPVTIKNVAEQEITVCLDVCSTIAPGEFFTR